MIRWIARFLMVVFAVIAASCSATEKRTENSSDTEQEASLSGNWQWLRSTGSIAGITVTPENSGKRMEIQFTQDKVFNKYVDDQLVYTSPYTIQLKDSIIQYTTLALFESAGLGFDHQVEQQFRIIDTNTLLLIDPCCDNFTFEFER